MTRLAIVLAFALVACGGKKDEPPPSGGSGSGSAPAGSGSATAAGSGSGSGSAAGSGSATAVAKELDLPTEVDFEDDATARITEKNIDAELKAIEKQLAP